MCEPLTGSSAPWRLCRGLRRPAAGWLDSSPLSDWGCIRCSRSKEPAPLPETHTQDKGVTVIRHMTPQTVCFNMRVRDDVFTWKWGLEIQAAICLKSGSWTRMNWDGSITSRISSISPRNITWTHGHANTQIFYNWYIKDRNMAPKMLRWIPLEEESKTEIQLIQKSYKKKHLRNQSITHMGKCVSCFWSVTNASWETSASFFIISYLTSFCVQVFGQYLSSPLMICRENVKHINMNKHCRH